MSETSASDSSRASAETSPSAADQLAALAERSEFTDEELEALYAVGQGHWMRRQFDRAGRVFGVLSMLRPGSIKYTQALGLTQRAVGRSDKALLAFMYLHALDPNDPQHELEMADCLVRIRQPGSALKLLDGLLARAKAAASFPLQVLERAQGMRALAARSIDAAS